MFRFVYSLAAFLLLPILAQAAEPVPSTPIRLVEEADWPPFTPAGGGAVVTQGLSLDLMQAVFSRLGVPFTLEAMPQSRLLKMLAQGAEDGVTEISETPERAQFLAFSTPLVQKRGFVYYNADRLPGFQWTSFADLKNLTVGFVQGHNYGADFDRAVAEVPLNAQSTTTEESGFRMLMLGRVDVILSTDVVADALIKNNAEFAEHIRPATKPYFVKGYSIGISRRSPWLAQLPRIDEAIAAIKADGTFARIVANYQK